MDPPVAVITGGRGDLAGELARQLATSGYTVLAPGRTELDVRKSDSVDSFFAGIDRVDLLVNNAGITRDALFPRVQAENWDEVMRTNLKGAHLCSQAAARFMMKQRAGTILNIGSYSALHPPLGQSSYAAAKAGLIGLTKSYASELGKRNIRVNCILPGFLETKMTRDLSEEARQAALDRHALGRFNTIEEAARFLVFLAETTTISGQVFQLDSRV